MSEHVVGFGPNIQKTQSVQGNPTDFVSQTVTDTASALTSVPPSAHMAVIQPQGANIRYRLDGVDPDTNTGIILYNGNSITLGNKAQIDGFRAIRDDSTNATVAIQYYVTP